MISGVSRTYEELEVGAVYRSRHGRTVLEDAPIALQPRPGDDAVAAVAPEPDRPLRLAPLVLAQPPRDVADVPRRAWAEQPLLLESELLHPCDDLWRESHV